MRHLAIWAGFIAVLVIPLAVSAASPLLAFRQPIYVLAGLAGVIALGLLLVQPLLAGGYLPGVAPAVSRTLHRWVGALLVLTVLIHVAALWATSPPDVIDALLFASPTPFSVWGVIAMWAVFATAVLTLVRRHLRPLMWRKIHTALALIVVSGTVLHAMLIDGTMGTASKAIFCLLVVASVLKVIVDRRIWALPRRGRG